MHKCLRIDEILSLIAVQLRKMDEADSWRFSRFSNPNSNEPYPYINHMALVCRTFYEPAMDVLWADLRGLAPLFRLLPEEKVQWELGPKDIPIPRFTDTILPHEWERFRQHARRVRSLMIGEPDYDPESFIPEECLLALRTLSPGGLFPGLRTLKCFPGDGPSLPIIPYLDAFLQPSLRTLEYENQATEEVVQLLEMAGKRVPGLTELEGTHDPEWWTGTWTPILRTRMADAISSLQSLTTFTLGIPLEGDTLHQLASLPNLRVLKCIVTTTTYGSPQLHSRQERVFPALQSLDIFIESNASDIEPMTRFLRKLRSPDLYRIRALGCISYAPGKFKNFVAALSSHTGIENLWIAFTPRSASWLPGMFLEAGDVLLPLNRLQRLRALNITGLPMRHTAFSLGHISATWKHLVFLRLTDGYHYQCVPICLWDLLPLAKHCPQLSSVECEVLPWMPSPEDISQDEDLRPFLSEDSKFTSSLLELAMGQAAFEPRFIPDLAVFLARFFPATKIKSIRGGNCEQIQQINSLREQHLRDMADGNVEASSA